jgi:hypothetical protein
MSDVTVHCPACGGGIKAPVRVEAVKLSQMGKRVEVFFGSVVVDHVCEDDDAAL